MLVVAGATGTLGTQVVRLLTGRGLDVRVLTRDAARARHLAGEHVEVVTGDVRDPRAVERAVSGARAVISAVHGPVGSVADNPRTVDGLGNANLIRAAEQTGVEQMVLVSMRGAAADHPMELARMKYAAEQQLRASELAWTIIRPPPFMETWAKVLGEPLLSTGRTFVFGRGDNPINFVSAHDVARLVELAIVDPALRGAVLEIGGPENLTLYQFVQVFAQVTGISGSTRSLPLSVMRCASALLRPVRHRVARQIQAGVVMATSDLRFAPEGAKALYPWLRLTSLAEVVGRDYAPREQDQAAAARHPRPVG